VRRRASPKTIWGAIDPEVETHFRFGFAAEPEDGAVAGTRLLRKLTDGAGVGLVGDGFESEAVGLLCGSARELTGEGLARAA
jgi:hypothetical protein